MKKILIKVFSKLGVIGAFNLTYRIIVNNRTISIPLIRKFGMEHAHGHELWMIQLLEKLLPDRKDKAYVDVGVNLGQTLIKLKSVSADIRYYGFEPNPACIYYVRELVKANQFKNITLFPVGISDKTAIHELSFFSEDDTDSSASTLSNFRPNQKTFRKEYIACFTISDVIDKCHLPSVGIIKIDVEGAEKEVLEGFKGKIETDRPLIQLEILPVYDEQNKERYDRQRALEELFRELDYTMFRIHTDEQNRLTGLEEIPTIGIHSNMKWCEYLIVPSAIKETIKKTF